MFVQVIKGKVKDAAGLQAAMGTWIDELAPDTTGWLGSTTGMTDDGTGIAVARFDSVENARRNSDRPEQGRWWAETERLFDGEVTFDESVTADEHVSGDPDTAGFVQIMRGRASDLERARELRRNVPADLSALRPELLAILDLAHDDGRWTTVAYFTSEADARKGEAQEPPREFAEMMRELNTLIVGEIEFFDLRQVWMYSPSRAAAPSMAGGAG